MKYYYQILNVPPDAPDQMLRASYKRISAEHGAIADLRKYLAAIQELNEAFTLLLDDEKRADYDDERERSEATDAEIPIERDELSETEWKIQIENCTAYYIEPGEIQILGELASSSGKAINDYREIRFNVYDATGKLLGTNYTNWGNFGRHQSFDETVYYKPKKAVPAKIRVIPKR